MHVYCGLMEPRWREIADEDLVRDAPRMRYLIADRLEQIWNACEPHVTGDAARPDHRYVETARMVETALAELESRIKPS
jgi:hypothetical protein